MPRKKLEVIELNKKEEKIILEQKQTPWAIFWKRNGTLIYLTSLMLMSFSHIKSPFYKLTKKF